MWDIIATYLVPFLSIAVTYLCATLQANRSEAREALRGSYEAYYRPVVELLYSCRLWECSFSQIQPGLQLSLYTLLTSAVEHIHEKDLHCLDQLTLACMDARPDHLEDEPSPEALSRLDAAVYHYIIRTLCRSLQSERLLHRARISRYVLSRYLENRGSRRNLPREEERRLARVLWRRR